MAASKRTRGERAGRKVREVKDRAGVAPTTYTSKELCARYRCAQRTLRFKEKVEGFPHGERFGRNVVYSIKAVHDWERVHMPGLNPEPELSEEDQQWNLLHQHRVLEKASAHRRT